MPLLRTDTGCRCKKTLVSITTTRLRRSRGAGWRKMLFQTCDPRIQSPMAGIKRSSSGANQQAILQQNVRIRVVPLAKLFLELARLVHDQLAVVGFLDGVALERAR